MAIFVNTDAAKHAVQALHIYWSTWRLRVGSSKSICLQGASEHSYQADHCLMQAAHVLAQKTMLEKLPCLRPSTRVCDIAHASSCPLNGFQDPVVGLTIYYSSARLSSGCNTDYHVGLEPKVCTYSMA